MDKSKGTETASAKPFASAFNLLSPSIEIVKRNLTSFVLFLIIPLALTFVSNVLTAGQRGTDPLAPYTGISGLLLFLSGLITLLTIPALTLVELKGARAETIEPDDAFSFGLRKVLKMLGLLIVMAVIFVVSFLLLIVPLFFMLRRYILAPYYLIDQNLGIIEALKASAADSKAYSKPIWGLIGVQVLVGLTGAVPVLGLILGPVASILYAASPAVRYEQIKAAKAGKDPLAPIEKAITA